MLRRAVVAVVLEELLEHVVERRALGQVGHALDALFLDRLGRGNVHHRLSDCIDEIGEIGRARLCNGGRERRRDERQGDCGGEPSPTRTQNREVKAHWGSSSSSCRSARWSRSYKMCANLVRSAAKRAKRSNHAPP